MMSAVKIMSIIDLLIGVALVIAGVIAATYKSPDYCTAGDTACKEDYDNLQNLLTAIALWGTIPAIIPVIFGGLGIFAGIKQSKSLVGVCLAFAIVGAVLCGVGFYLPMVGAAIVSTICDVPDTVDIRSTQEGIDFCDRFGGALWAVAILNIVLAIYQVALSITLCCACCNSKIWEQKVAPEEGVPVAEPA
jgi:hypothetical protein